MPLQLPALAGGAGAGQRGIEVGKWKVIHF
jgi:hypothetical protein